MVYFIMPSVPWIEIWLRRLRLLDMLYFDVEWLLVTLNTNFPFPQLALLNFEHLFNFFVILCFYSMVQILNIYHFIWSYFLDVDVFFAFYVRSTFLWNLSIRHLFLLVKRQVICSQSGFQSIGPSEAWGFWWPFAVKICHHFIL